MTYIANNELLTELAIFFPAETTSKKALTLSVPALCHFTTKVIYLHIVAKEQKRSPLEDG